MSSKNKENKEKEKPEEEKAEIEKKPSLKKTEQQIRELTELLQRTQANFENYRKQQEKRFQEIQNQANRNLVLQLLPVLDNFELALKNTHRCPEDSLKGIELIYAQLFTILENQGLKPIPTENQLFDPHLHEALAKVPSDRPENFILEELQKGFLLNNQVIRHAKVKVSAGPKRKENKKTKEKENKNKERKNQEKIELKKEGGLKNDS